MALYKLWAAKGGEPLRIISLHEWGYEPEVTGSSADLQWSPDNRALAVRGHTCCLILSIFQTEKDMKAQLIELLES